jgi:hypothetical protein
MQTRALGLVLVCASFAAATPAHAECAPERYFGTPSGTTIPTHGSIYLFDKSYGRSMFTAGTLAVHFFGRPGVYEVVPLGDGLERLDYLSFDGGALDVTLGGDWTHALYPLSADWQREPPPRVLQYWHVLPDRYAPDDIRTGAVEIQIDQPVAAIDARWVFGDHATEWRMAPHTVEDFVNTSVVEIGDIPCGVNNLAIDEVIAGGHLELTAVRFDGSRAVIHGLPARLVESEMPRDSQGMGHALKRGLGAPRFRVLSQTPREIAQDIPADWNPFVGLDDVLGAALLGGGGLAIGCFLFLKLRRGVRV